MLTRSANLFLSQLLRGERLPLTTKLSGPPKSANFSLLDERFLECRSGFGARCERYVSDDPVDHAGW